MTLDATYGGASANAYITVADADTWIRDHVLFAEAWERVQSVGKRQELALLHATRQIEAAAVWRGTPYFWNQALAFPRVLGATGIGWPTQPDASFQTLLEQDVELTQQKAHVQAACCFQAVYVLAEGRDIDREEQFRGASSTSLGHRFSESRGYGGTHMILCPDAWNELGRYEGNPQILRGGSRGGIPVVP